MVEKKDNKKIRKKNTVITTRQRMLLPDARGLKVFIMYSLIYSLLK
jgi:hypothetical protein